MHRGLQVEERGVRDCLPARIGFDQIDSASPDLVPCRTIVITKLFPAHPLRGRQEPPRLELRLVMHRVRDDTRNLTQDVAPATACAYRVARPELELFGLPRRTLSLPAKKLG